MPPRLRSPLPLTHHMNAWRKHRKMTLQQVADAIGSTKGHLSRIENGDNTLMPEVAEAVAHLFSIDSETLRRRKPDVPVDLEQELLMMFRGADINVQKAILSSARVIVELGKTKA